jgi:hypothetical protein
MNKTSPWTLLRIVALLICALGVMAFDSCNDDPLLDSEGGGSGGGGCAGSHCSARIVPDSAPNPASF